MSLDSIPFPLFTKTYSVQEFRWVFIFSYFVISYLYVIVYYLLPFEYLNNVHPVSLTHTLSVLT